MTEEQQEVQDDWALDMITQQMPHACPDDYPFERGTGDEHAYVCGSRTHSVTDELLAEGRGGMMAAPPGRGRCDFEDFEGPFYLGADDDRFHTEDPKYHARRDAERKAKGK